MDVSRYFEGIAWKYLSAVDAEPRKSNQHEFGGLVAAGFGQYLGDPAGREKVRFPAEFIWLDDEESESISERGQVTWYDARFDNPNRGPELRLYYTTNSVSERFQADDFCLFAKRRSGGVLVVTCAAGSTSEHQLRWLFELPDVKSSFRSKDTDKIHEKQNLPASWILELLGIDVDSSVWESHLERMLSMFGSKFPTTRVFSEFARECARVKSEDVGFDDALLAWVEAEEGLFRVFEKYLVESWLNEGFAGVDDFVAKSLSVQNRRKSRAGHALENHLEKIFSDAGLLFARGAVTENRAKPDFLFPSFCDYHNEKFSSDKLRMLGAKATCKDRWRQVLAEAKRINEKHLITLEPGISRNQTREMMEASLQLVVPERLQATFMTDQQDWLISVNEFVHEVRVVQG